MNITLTVDANTCGVSAAEKQALIDLYNATNGPNWTNTWDTVNDEPCDWFGVIVVNGNVTELRLSSNGLSGTIPSTIGDLVNITYIDLGSNNLSGSIPAEIGNLTNLLRLYLYFNSLTGSIPSELGANPQFRVDQSGAQSVKRYNSRKSW